MGWAGRLKRQNCDTSAGGTSQDLRVFHPLAHGVLFRSDSHREEVGGIVPHVMLESIASDAPPKEEVLVDRPEADNKITRVTGAFCVEGTISTPVDISEGAIGESEISDLRKAAIGDSRISESPARRLKRGRVGRLP